MLGLLSFHTALNYGARLQCYALQQALKLHGYDSEYINYENQIRRNNYQMTCLAMQAIHDGKWSEAVKIFCGIPFIARRRKSFRDFDRKYMKVSSVYIADKSEIAIKIGNYDKYIVGSDQVWNCLNNGKDTTYLLDFVSDKKQKISYASSFGMAKIPEDMKISYARCLSNFGALSTRESNGVQLIKELTGYEAKLVLDPVFLLPRIEWERLTTKKKNKNPFIFAYLNRKGQYKDFLDMTGFDDSKYMIHLLSRHINPKDFLSQKIKVCYCMSPNDFIENISEAELVVTASFHCVAFSIILNKPFIAILVGDEGKDARILSLLRSFGLEYRILREGLIVNEKFMHLDEPRVNAKMEALRNESLAFLLDAIER